MRSGCILLVALLASSPVSGQTFSGTGDRATGMFVLPVGVAVFELRTQASPVTVELINDRGEVESRLFDGARATEAVSRSIDVRRPGRYLLNVRTGGEWQIALRVAGGGSVQENSDGAVSVEHATGRIYGREAAARVGTGRYLIGGFLAGATLGPIGMALTLAHAGNASTDPPESIGAQLSPGRITYNQAFEEAYREKLKSDRRTSALVGSLVGTSVLAFVLVERFVISPGGDDSGGRPPPGETHIVLPDAAGRPYLPAARTRPAGIRIQVP